MTIRVGSDCVNASVIAFENGSVGTCRISFFFFSVRGLGLADVGFFSISMALVKASFLRRMSRIAAAVSAELDSLRDGLD